MTNLESVESKSFILKVSYRFLKERKDYYWLIGVCLLATALAIHYSSVTTVLLPLLTALFMIVSDARAPRVVVRIVILDGVLSFQNDGAVLWSSPLKEIKSIEIEARGLFQLGARKAMIIRTEQDDSFYQSLDGVTVEDYEIPKMVDEIQTMRKLQLS